MSEEVELIVKTSFWGAFLLDLLIVAYAYRLSKKMGGSGLLNNTVVYAGASAFVFGIHHILEIFLEQVPGGLAVAEAIEGIAAILLGIAVYQLYALVRGD